MSNRKNMKRRQSERLPSTLRGGSGLAAVKLVIGAGLGVLLCIAIVAYIVHGKRKDAPGADSQEKAAVSIGKQAEPNDSTAKLESQPAPKPAVVDVNEQIEYFKQRKLELAKKLHDKFPDRSAPLILLGNIYRDLGSTSEAIRYWKKASEIGPERPDLYEGMGTLAMENGQYSKAIDFWRQSLGLNPRAVGLRTSIAQALMRLGEFDEAMKELNRQIYRYPTSKTALFLTGQIFLQKKEYEQAREKYLKVLDLDPGHTNAHYGLLTVSARLREKDKMQEYREQFNKLKARDTQGLIDHNKLIDDLAIARKSYAEAALKAAQLSEQYGWTTEAGALLDEAIRASEGDPDILVRIAQWHHRQGRVQESLALHERIAERHPENGLNSFLLGALYARFQRFDEAKESYMSSIEHSPDSSDAYRELAKLCLHTKQDIRQAKVLAEKAVSLAPLAVNYFVLSRACDVNGDRAGALSALEEAVELDPNNDEYRRIYGIIARRKE